jgi:AraC family transcriptional activator of tynA and feaB
MEAAGMNDMASLVDLSAIAHGQRAAAWTNAAPLILPGLSVGDLDADLQRGDILSIPMGGGSLWAIRSPAAIVTYAPSPERSHTRYGFTLLLQRSGASEVFQKRQRGSVSAGDICLIDERFPFRIKGHGFGETLFLRMPREPVLSRHPHLQHRTAVAMHGVQPGVRLLADMLASILVTAPFMGSGQRQSALLAFIHLLGAAETAIDDLSGVPLWRIQAALSYIDLNFVHPGLCAEDVADAQQISRRRLDQLLHAAIGVSVTRQIWTRRLEQSAADLRDPARASLTVALIAFANGFEDAAHFTRAFKVRYGQSPSEWRKRHIGADAARQIDQVC